jgi:hypothetical protein
LADVMVDAASFFWRVENSAVFGMVRRAGSGYSL